jgi:hypothetical protein
LIEPQALSSSKEIRAPNAHAAFVIVRDARGALVHVRTRETGECIGCIEVGLFEIVRRVVVAEELRRPLRC